MARFYEEYGHFIVLLLTAALGIGLICWALIYASHHHILPPTLAAPLIAFDTLISAAILWVFDFVEKRLQWFGAIATAFTFVFGLVSGIRQAKRQLPRRLVEFMREKMQPVHDNTELILAAMSPRMVDVNRRALFQKTNLNNALRSIAGEYRPSKRSTLSITIQEVDTAIAVTAKRLQHLNDLKAHAQLLRGVFADIEASPKDVPPRGTTAEADFSAAREHDATRMAALELRGLLRAKEKNYSGALQDFGQLEVEAGKTNCTRAKARALRHAADVLRYQAANSGSIATLRQARRRLNTADKLFDDGRTLGDLDWEEKALNREAYGWVLEAIAGYSETDSRRASDAFKEAKARFARMREGNVEHIARVDGTMKKLQAPHEGDQPTT